MSHSSNRIYAPVQMKEDFAAILQISGEHLDVACKSTAINKWAKYKPVSKNVIEALTEAQRQSVNYGISKIPTWSNINKMITFWLLEDRRSSTNYPDCGLVDEYWDYTHPSGGSGSPYRETDFAVSSSLGYFHGAEAPLKGLHSLSAQITADGQLVLNWDLGAQNSETLKFTDLKYDTGSQISLAGFYFTAILARVGATGTQYAMTDVDQSAASAIEQAVHCRPYFQDLAHVNAFMGNADQADFYCMICLSNQEIYDTFTYQGTTYRKFLSSFGSISANNFVALMDRRQTVTITKMVAKCAIIEMLAWKESGDNHFIYFSLTVRNNDTIAYRNYNITVTVWDNNTQPSTMGQTEYNKRMDPSGQITIAERISVSSVSGSYRVNVKTAIRASVDQAKITETDETTVNISSTPPVTPVTPTPY